MKSNELNKEVRRKIAKNKLRNYEVANHMGVSPFTFAHWLQTELPAERKKAVLKAIDELVYAESNKK